MKIIKFGGKSLANGEGIANVISIIKNKYQENPSLAFVLSARGKTTDRLCELLESAKHRTPYTEALAELKAYQLEPLKTMNYEAEFAVIEQILNGVRLLEDYSLKIKDTLMAQGEIMSCKLVVELLREEGVNAVFGDARKFIRTNSNFGNAVVHQVESAELTQAYFDSLESGQIPVITGFIASDTEGNTTTLGRNGSNYSASLLASYIAASKLESYTHVNGIYSANPDLVPKATVIRELGYLDASELASFGTSILHPKTIEPLLEKKIPLHILNTFNADNEGTLIKDLPESKTAKSISVQQNVSLINIDGKDLLGKVGVDGRIFMAMKNAEVSVGIISQGSSERGVSFVVDSACDERAVEALQSEFALEFINGDIASIEAQRNISVLTIIGASINQASQFLIQFRKNNISPLLINSTLNRKNVSIVLPTKDEEKAVNLVHSQIFGIATEINIAVFGVGTVGSVLIDQILSARPKILESRGILLNIFAIANSKTFISESQGIDMHWKQNLLDKAPIDDHIQGIITYAKTHHLENLIAIDNTASVEFIEHYTEFIEQGFDLVSSNKIANTQSYDQYEALRASIKKHNKEYLYETNVGAGLPIIDTIKILHQSGENITKIKGVFSGSLSYIFNEFSSKDIDFDTVLKEAMKQGYTEPDPREDLCGNDVARKLLILARELELRNEFDEIEIENLIPQELREVPFDDFMEKVGDLDSAMKAKRNALSTGEVLRYVGELSGDLQQDKGVLKVSLEAVSSQSPLGSLTGSDSLIEIYTDSYGDKPITIIGAGAGAEVTARGVLGDVIRLSNAKKVLS